MRWVYIVLVGGGTLITTANFLTFCPFSSQTDRVEFIHTLYIHSHSVKIINRVQTKLLSHDQEDNAMNVG